MNALGRWLIAGVLFAWSTAVASGQFQIDIGQAEMRRLVGRPAVTDLAVGEVGLLDRSYICGFEGQLYVYALAPLATKRSEYGNNFEVKRLPGGGFAISVTAGASAGVPIDDFLEGFFSNPHPCKYYTTQRSELEPVATLNGQTSLTDLWQKVLN